ncbi:MAG: hypothetical protein IT323_21945, partial [Anaerolineae bacterium]|nr:hypothetical protein [Anaerolineae bacterium]
AALWMGLVPPTLVYGVAALFITWPLVTQIGTVIAGGGWGDSFEYVRLGWWAGHALTTGQNPFVQSLFAYPDGLFSATQAAQPLIYWPGALLGLLVGPVAGFNVFLMGILILNGLSAYWLCRCLLLEHAAPSPAMMLAALIGGLVFMAFPAQQGHLAAGHVNPLSNYGLPLLALSLWRIATGRGDRRTILLGAAAILALGLSNFTFPVYGLLPLLLFGGGYVFVARRWALRPRAAGQIAWMLGGGFLLLVPFYLPLVAEALAPERPAYLQEGGSVRYSADLLAFVSPSPFTPWTRGLPDFTRDVLGANNTEGAAYVGVVAAVLALTTLWRRGKSAQLWLVIALGGMILSLGPLLKWRDQPVRLTIDGLSTHLALPWALFQDLPIVDITRTPGRFNVTAGLALGVLAAFGLHVIVGRARRVRVQAALSGALAVVILFEYQLFWPFPVIPAALPGVFAALRERDDVRAVFDVPWNDPVAQKDALYEQTAHGHPLIAGYVSRGTSVDPARLALLSDAATGALADEATARGLLRARGADVIVYHRALLDWEPTLAFAERAFGPALYVDEWRAVYAVPAGDPLPAGPLFTLAPDGWPHDESGAYWLTGTPDRVPRGEVYFTAAGEGDLVWRLDIAPLVAPRTLRIALDGEHVMSFAVSGRRTLVFHTRAAPGFHTLRLETAENCTPAPVAPTCLLIDGAAQPNGGCTLPAGQFACASLALFAIEAAPAGEMAFREQPVALDTGLSLLGFRAPARIMPGEALTVETTWRATQHLPGDYHLFVHMVGADGQPVAQFDGAPGENTFPTTAWDAPQTWIEAVHIDVPAGSAPGVYRLFTGWYRYPDLIRLSVLGDAPGAADG